MWAILAAGAALLGGITKAVGASKESKAKEKMAKENEAQAEKEAGQIEEAYQLRLSDLQTQQKRFAGHQKTLIGRAGVQLTSGSPLALMSETSRMMAEDVRRLKLEGQMAKEGRLFEASQYGEEAGLYRKTRPWQVGGSLLGGVAQGASFFI